MKKIKLRLIAESITLEEVNQFELGVLGELPDEYKNFLVENNGGFPREKMFINEEFECDVSLFYSLKHGKYNLEGVLDRVYDDNGLNNSYFPFASSGSGSLYVFSLKEKDYGVVYLDHMDDSDIVKLSDSFSGFLDNLQELDW